MGELACAKFLPWEAAWQVQGTERRLERPAVRDEKFVKNGRGNPARVAQWLNVDL